MTTTPQPSIKTTTSPLDPRVNAEPGWRLAAHDRKLTAELCARLPQRVFDVHVHLLRHADLGMPQRHASLYAPDSDITDYATWKRVHDEELGAGRVVGGLFFPFPAPNCNAPAANQWLLNDIARHPESRALVLVKPGDDPEQIRRFAENPQVVGIKCYHVYSDQKPTMHAPMESFLPEWMWKLCNDLGWLIMLHLVRKHALADEGNQRTIRAMCTKYPRAKLVLPHAGRGFNQYDTLKGLEAVRGLHNVWFDTSAICEPAAMTAILHEFGPSRLMWGTDLPISEWRGKCVSVGDYFSWINPASIDASAHGNAELCPTHLVGLESLRAVIQALDEFGANESDFQDVFYMNAARLVGVERAADHSGQSLYRYASRRIPGGVQLLSKKPEMHLPEQWPAYFKRARGCETMDLDGRIYYDFNTNGIGACLLGFGDPDVDRAVRRRINMGTASTLNAPEEVELADLLCHVHPWAEQVRYTRSGGEALSVAVRVARATTGRSVVAICGYHGWHDWYLAANLGDNESLRGHLLPGLEPAGVPSELRGTIQPFAYNKIGEFLNILAQHGTRLAAVVMEPRRYTAPEPGFLEKVRDLAHAAGALFVFDEVTIGWRAHLGGYHLKLGVQPDMAVFAKATGNGYPIGAIIGTSAAMEGAHRSFISSTNWTESIGPTAALATIKKMQRVDVPGHITRIGQKVSEIWRRNAAAAKLAINVTDAMPQVANFAFQHAQANELRTLFTQLMLERGFLAGMAVYATMAHTDEIVAKYDTAVGESFAEIAKALERDSVVKDLKGPVVHTGFRRLVS